MNPEEEAPLERSLGTPARAPAPVAASVAAEPAREARLLDVERVTKRCVTSDGAITAVDNISFSIAPGEFVSIIGPSGCGKSTLFNIIGGLVGDYEGRVTVAGEVVSGTHPAIGMVFQEESTFPWRTVLENVAFPPSFPAGCVSASRWPGHWLPSRGSC